MNITKILCFTLLMIALTARFYRLGDIPYGVNWDEANNGYTAYSLLKTGHDEWGKPWPLFTKAFGEYKSIIYATLTIIPVRIFGLNNFSVRFASVFFSCLAIISFYFLVRQVLIYYRWDKQSIGKIAVIATLILAYNPWFFFFSRYGENPVTSLAMMIFALTAWFYWVNGKKVWYLIAAVVFSALAVYGYHSARLIVPAMWIFGLIQNWRLFWKYKAQAGIALALTILLVIPFYLALKKGEVTKRAHQVLVWDSPGIEQEFNVFFNEASFQHAGGERWMENKKMFYLKKVGENVISNISLDFLFNSPVPNYRMGTGSSGRFYPLELFFILVGAYWLWTKNKKCAVFLGWWIWCAVLPSAIATEAPHAVRSLFLSFPIVMVTAVGFNAILEKKNILFMTTLVILLYAGSVAFFARDYFIHFPFKSVSDWQPEYEAVFRFIQPIQDRYEKVFVDTALGQPYIFLFYYQKVDPSEVQQYLTTGETHEISFSAMDRYRQFYFWPATDNDYLETGNLILSQKKLDRPSLNLLHEVRGKQNQSLFYIYETI